MSGALKLPHHITNHSVVNISNTVKNKETAKLAETLNADWLEE